MDDDSLKATVKTHIKKLIQMNPKTVVQNNHIIADASGDPIDAAFSHNAAQAHLSEQSASSASFPDAESSRMSSAIDISADLRSFILEAASNASEVSAASLSTSNDCSCSSANEHLQTDCGLTRLPVDLHAELDSNEVGACSFLRGG